MKNVKKASVGLGLLIATALVAGCTEADAAEAVAYEPAVVETVVEEPELEDADGTNLVDGILFQSDEIIVEEIPLLTLENAGPLTISPRVPGLWQQGGEVVFDVVDAHAQSISDFVLVTNLPLQWDAGLFFLNPDGLSVWNEDHPKFGDEDFSSENAEFRVGDYILPINYEQFNFDWDAIDDYAFSREDIHNGIPTVVTFLDFPEVGYFVFTPIDSLLNGIQSLAVSDGNQSVDLQLRFDDTLELVDAAFVDNGFGGYRIDISVRLGGTADRDTAWRLTSLAQDLPRSIRIIDVDSEEPLVWSVPFGSDGLPNILEITLIPELVDTVRQFASQNG